MATHAERNAETRRRVMQAAIELFAERGYRGTSVAAIGERANMSRGVVNAQFGTKEALLREIVSEASAEWGRGVPIPEVSSVQDVVAAVDGLLMYHRYTLENETRKVAAMYALVFETLTAVPSLRNDIAALTGRQRLEVAAFVERAQSAGLVPEDLNAIGFATWVTSALRGINDQFVVDPGAIDVDATYAELRAGILSRFGVDALAAPGQAASSSDTSS